MVDCIFCKIARKEIKVKIIEESDNFLAFPDANPKVERHTLIISKKHFSNIVDLPALLGNELLDMIKKVGLLVMLSVFAFALSANAQTKKQKKMAGYVISN